MTDRVLGVDACKSGWIGGVLDRGRTSAYHAFTIVELVSTAEAAGELAVVAIDIPIGLPDAGRRRGPAGTQGGGTSLVLGVHHAGSARAHDVTVNANDGRSWRAGFDPETLRPHRHLRSALPVTAWHPHHLPGKIRRIRQVDPNAWHLIRPRPLGGLRVTLVGVRQANAERTVARAAQRCARCNEHPCHEIMPR